MNHSSSQPADSISALADGRLSEADAKSRRPFTGGRRSLGDLAYHVVGDVLRSSELAPAGADDLAFWHGLEQRMPRKHPPSWCRRHPCKVIACWRAPMPPSFAGRSSRVGLHGAGWHGGWNQGWAPTIMMQGKSPWPLRQSVLRLSWPSSRAMAAIWCATPVGCTHGRAPSDGWALGAANACRVFAQCRF